MVQPALRVNFVHISSFAYNAVRIIPCSNIFAELKYSFIISPSTLAQAKSGSFYLLSNSDPLVATRRVARRGFHSIYAPAITRFHITTTPRVSTSLLLIVSSSYNIHKMSTRLTLLDDGFILLMAALCSSL